MADGTDEVTEITEADFTKVAGVTAPANRVPYVLLKAKGKDEKESGDEPVTPFGENAGEKLSAADRAKFKENEKDVKQGKEPAAKGDGEPHEADTNSPEADAQEQEMTDSAAKAAHDEGAFCGDEDCAKCVIKDGESYRLRTGVSPVTKAARQSQAYWDAVIKRNMDPNVGGGVDRDKIPDEDFAGDNRSFPIVNPGDVQDAASSIGRASSKNFSGDKLKENIKRIAHRKGPKFVAQLPKKWQKEDAKKADESSTASVVSDEASKGAVQDALAGTKAPEGSGTVVDGSTQSMTAATAGVKANLGSVVPSDQSPSSVPGVVARLRGGESAYVIPAEQEAYTLRNPGPSSPQIAMDASKAQAVSSLFEAMDQIGAQRAAAKQGAFLQVPGPTAAQNVVPGSMPWESYDSATLDQVACVLAQCCNAVECICTREQIEALSGDAGDQGDAYSLLCAQDCLDQAMGIVARLAYAEGAEAMKSAGGVEKAYRRLYAGDQRALRDAHAAIANVLAEHERAKAKGAPVKAGSSTSEPSEGDQIQMELTKEELVATIETSAQKASSKAVKSAMRADRKRASKAAAKAERRAQKAAEKAVAEALKNANNGGDISQQQLEGGITSTHDASDIQSVGGAVQSKYVNKAIKKAAKKAAKKSALAQFAGQLEALSASQQTVGQLVKSFAGRPRGGGPVLDGVPRGGLFASAERADGAGQVAKSDRDQRIEVLEKQYQDARSDLEKQNVGFELTKLRLEKSHEAADQSLPIRFLEGF